MTPDTDIAQRLRKLAEQCHDAKTKAQLDEAFRPLVEELTPLLNKKARSKLSEHADADVEDHVQDVFMKLYRALKAGKEIEFPLAWSMHCLTCRLIDAFRKKKKEKTIKLMCSSEAPGRMHHASTEMSPRMEVLTSIAQSIAESLPTNERSILEEYCEGTKPRDIASKLNIPRDHVYRITAKIKARALAHERRIPPEAKKDT
ncbi:sigma-70 family RNA polymerase sigma factor [Archangium lansingense]|uniref:Sigma-70 family RNA polymerase sigma factor n=1 Tax=Archangium lansingense TaxID=2995310 RepID=A0ABT4AD50_9BACT|nr:sigma-70 family RNA polymerase sigma factor [Archangium lansinium]MCY1079591.1 sigma-70 family RNA polymerase sigma factor [Archangium lansinium]